MASFIIRRLGQALVVLLVMSVLVFAGVYVIGNPVDVLISPDAALWLVWSNRACRAGESGPTSRLRLGAIRLAVI